jgi:hypothetical protein
MKKIILFVVLVAGLNFLYAQRVDSSSLNKIDVVKEYRRELFKTKLSLTDKELDAFLTVYNEHQIEIRKVKRTFRRKWFSKDADNLSNAVAQEYFNDAMALQKAEQALIEKYAPLVAEAIGWSKAIRVKKVENEIKPLLLAKANTLKLQKSKKPPKKKKS